MAGKLARCGASETCRFAGLLASFNRRGDCGVIMSSTHETTGVVEHGSVKLPPGVQLPEGTPVRVSWDAIGPAPDGGPYDRRALTEEDVRADLAWATRDSRTQ